MFCFVCQENCHLIRQLCEDSLCVPLCDVTLLKTVVWEPGDSSLSDKQRPHPEGRRRRSGHWMCSGTELTSSDSPQMVRLPALVYLVRTNVRAGREISWQALVDHPSLPSLS